MKKWIKWSGLLLATALLVACSQTQKETTSSSSSSSTTTSQSSTSEVRSQPSQASPSSQLTSEEYHVAYGDKNLYGMLTAPANYKELKLPVIVLAHGFNNTLEQYEDYAHQLASQGYVVYRFDFYGGSRQSKSGGQDMLDMSVKTELEDLTQVVNQLSSESYVDDQHINLLGTSQGGVVATLYAAGNPDRVHKLMLIFPAYVLFDDVRATYASYGANSPSDLPEVITHRNARLGRRYLTEAMEIDIDAELKKVTAPTLIVHGTEDDVVPYSYGVSASQTIPNAQLVTVQGGGHWISSDFNAVAQPAIETFLKE